MTDLSQMSTEDLIKEREALMSGAQPRQPEQPSEDLSSLSNEDLLKMRYSLLAQKKNKTNEDQRQLRRYRLDADKSTPFERFLGGVPARFVQGMVVDPIESGIQIAANVGEKLADVTGMTGRFGGTKFRQAGAGTPYPAELANVSTGPDGKEIKYYGPPPLGISAENVNKFVAEREAMKRRGMAGLSGRPLGEEWDVAGGLGSLAPGTAVYKTISSLLPKALSETSKSLSGRTLGRMLAGGGTAALTIPDTTGDTENYLSNLGIKTGIGAAVPVGVSTLGSLVKGGVKLGGQSLAALRDTFRNFTGSGQEVLAEQHLRKLASEGGEPAIKKTIGSLLDEKRILGKMTSKEAIAAGNIRNPSERFGGPLVRLQEELSVLPEATTKMRSIEAGQEQIRKAALGGIARGQKEESVLLERATAATKNYGKAFKEVVEADAPLKELMTRPSMKDVLSRAKDLAKEAGKKFNEGDKYPVESLHFMKMAMDDLIKNPERFGIGASEVRAISQTQNQFVKWLGQKSPAYDLARNEHKRISEVLNRVQVRDTLEKVLTGPRGEERTAQFLNAAREAPKTFKKATGSNRFEKLEDVLLPHEAKTVNKIIAELQRDAMATKMVREVNIPGATNPVTGNMAQLPSPLYRPTMIANWILKRGGEEGNKNVNKIAADILEDPKKAAEILSKTPPKWRSDVTNALQDFYKFARDPANVAAIQAAGETK